MVMYIDLSYIRGPLLIRPGGRKVTIKYIGSYFAYISLI